MLSGLILENGRFEDAVEAQNRGALDDNVYTKGDGATALMLRSDASQYIATRDWQNLDTGRSYLGLRVLAKSGRLFMRRFDCFRSN